MKPILIDFAELDKILLTIEDTLLKNIARDVIVTTKSNIELYNNKSNELKEGDTHRIIQKIIEAIDNAKAKSKNIRIREENETCLSLLIDILENIHKAIKNYQDKAGPKTNSTALELSLLNQQKFLMESKEVNEIFQNALVGISKKHNEYKSGHLCIISAEISDIMHSSSRLLNSYLHWVPSFLKNLKKHLVMSGIRRITLITHDEIECGANGYIFMRQIEEADTILLIGTEELLSRQSSKNTYDLHTQLAHLNRKRNFDARLGRESHIYPILLSGEPDTAFPAEFANIHPLIWKADSYLSNLQKLINLLHRVDAKEYGTIWNTFFETIPASAHSSLAGPRESMRSSPPSLTAVTNTDTASSSSSSMTTEVAPAMPCPAKKPLNTITTEPLEDSSLAPSLPCPPERPLNTITTEPPGGPSFFTPPIKSPPGGAPLPVPIPISPGGPPL